MKLLKWFSISLMIMTLFCFACYGLFNHSEINSQGILHEPLFFLLPVGAGLFALTCISFFVLMVKSKHK